MMDGCPTKGITLMGYWSLVVNQGAYNIGLVCGCVCVCGTSFLKNRSFVFLEIWHEVEAPLEFGIDVALFLIKILN